MILALTGAGISKASGIPTFDEMGDLREKLDRNYAINSPEDFNETINFMKKICDKAKPNDAHLALAEYDIPIMTMNIDSLHYKAKSKQKLILPLHGRLEDDNVVLYGDSAPNYSIAMDWINKMHKNDILLIIGTSFYTNISNLIKINATIAGADIIIINEDAEHKVREFLIQNQDKIENCNDFFNRKPYYENENYAPNFY